MFQKTILSTALLAGFAAVSFSAQAADVQLCGTVDYGFVYNHAKTTEPGADSVKDDSFSMASARTPLRPSALQGSKTSERPQGDVPPRNGLKPTRVRSTEGTIFDREASLAVSGRLRLPSTSAAWAPSSAIPARSKLLRCAGVGPRHRLGRQHHRPLRRVRELRRRPRQRKSRRSRPEFAGGFVYAQYAFDESGRN